MSEKVAGAQYIANPVKLTTSIPSTPECRLIRGSSVRMNTRKLAAQVSRTLSQGARPEDLLVISATPNGEDALLRAIADEAEALGVPEAAASLHITTMRALALEVLATDEAQAITGRDARLLVPFEESFLMQDMRGYGMDPKRLREMLQFFYKTLSELGDDNPNWLINDQETTTFTQLRECLGFIRGILEPELGNLLVNYLRSSQAALDRWSRAHVFVDGYQSHCRASQFAANLLARESITAAACEQVCTTVFESYPYAQGADELLRINPHTEFIKADPQDKPRQSIHACATPADELAHLAEAAQLGAEDLYVATPNRVWARNAAAALAQQGFAVELAFDRNALSGDVRDLGKCQTEAILTVLALIANPHDCVAWRSWCGFGDWLGNCGALAVLRSNGAKQQAALDGMLAQARDLARITQAPESVNGLGRVAQAVETAERLVEGAQGLTGRALLDYVTANLYGPDARTPNLVLQLCLGSDASEALGADQMVTTAFDRMHLPHFRQDGAVRIGSFIDGAGLQVERVLFLGMVNGLSPELRYFDTARTTKEQRSKILGHDRAMISVAEDIAACSVEYSWFGEAPLELAQKARMKIERIGLKSGKRMARLSLSVLVEEEEDAQ